MRGDVEGGGGAFDDGEVAWDVSDGEVECHGVAIRRYHVVNHVGHGRGVVAAMTRELPHDKSCQSRQDAR